MRNKRESGAAEPRGNLRIEPEKIQKVLDTAARLFATHGFDSVGIRTIAAESGVKMPSIYYHFTSKEALYDETAEMQYELAMERVAQAMNGKHLPGERIASFVSEVFDLFLTDRTFFLLVQRDVTDAVAQRTPQRFKSSYHYVINQSQIMLSKALARVVSKNDAFSVISLILGFCALTVVAAPSGDTGDAWHREQKQHLTVIVNRVLTV
jgi:AcrR family transcriptional regulator